MQYHRTVERTFSVGPRPTLRVANSRGELVVVGEDREDISFVAQLSADAESEREGEARLDAIRLPMHQAGDIVTVGPPEHDESPSGALTIFGFRVGVGWGGGTRVAMQVRVPRGCLVYAAHRSGTLRAHGMHADLHVESRSGRVEVGDVSGAVTIEARSGGTEARGITGNLAVDVRSGRVEVERVRGDVRLETRSGSVTAREVVGAISVRGRSGRIRLEDIDGPFDISTTAGSVEYRGRVAHAGSINVHHGSVRLAVTRDSGFYMDAESHHGSVRSDLPVDYLTRPPADAPTVRVRAHNGSIRVVAGGV
ncbi:MAG: DUF4097 family beta strand repeat protein [Dehalococcoidia bacterium]|nr:DUF4097 family beta strand repeat protein [Dehalococcoidia bacterium]